MHNYNVDILGAIDTLELAYTEINRQRNNMYSFS